MDLDQNEDMQGDKGEGADAPLIDLNEASIKKLIARAKRRGVIHFQTCLAAQFDIHAARVVDNASGIHEHDQSANVGGGDDGNPQQHSAKCGDGRKL